MNIKNSFLEVYHQIMLLLLIQEMLLSVTSEVCAQSTG